MYYLCSILLCTIIVLYTGLIEAASICDSAECNRTATKMLSYMDLSVKPCKNFYNFACGRYLKEKRIADYLQAIMFSTDFSATIDKQLKELIEKPIRKTDPRPFILVKKLYALCMNATLIRANGISELNELFEEIGGWPVLKGMNWDDDVTWEEIMQKLSKLGFRFTHTLLNIDIDADLKNSSRKLIYLDQPKDVISRESKPQVVIEYYHYMVDTAVYIGAEKEYARKELLEVLNFELELSGIMIPQEARRNYTAMYNPMTIEELQSNYTFLHWLKYLNKLWDPHISLTNEDEVIVMVPKYWAKFSLLMHKTPKRTIVNYILWKTVAGSVTYLTDDLRSKELHFLTFLLGISVKPPRWQECISICSQSLNIAVSSLYVRIHYKNSIEPDVKEMVSYIRFVFKESLEGSKWIDAQTKKLASEKLKLIFPYIGHPEELKNYIKLSKYYENLEINERSFLKSILNINMFDNDRELKNFREPINKTDWIYHSDSLTVEAYYKFQENSLFIPASILHAPIYGKNFPKYLNYGAIGFILAHELTHAFDDQGRQFDKNGNMLDWWTQKTSKTFNSKAQCFVKQYNSINVTEVNRNINGKLTLSENIADNGGIRTAYNAYRKWVGEHGVEPQLPGLNYTSQQMFWLSMAQSWCAKFRPQRLKTYLDNDPHTPPKYKVLEIFRNMEAFSRDFNCDKNANMNPKNKCRLW